MRPGDGLSSDKSAVEGHGGESHPGAHARPVLPAVVMVSSDTISKDRSTDSAIAPPVLLLDSERVYAALGLMSIGPDRSMTNEVNAPGLAWIVGCFLKAHQGLEQGPAATGRWMERLPPDALPTITPRTRPCPRRCRNGPQRPQRPRLWLPSLDGHKASEARFRLPLADS
jgi:hypothetical protein